MHSQAGRLPRKAMKIRIVIAATLAPLMLSGCVVLAVADTAATAVVKTGGLVVDGAVGAVKLTGKAVGAAVDVVIPDGEEKK
jgi:outer membrane murein-binding lipoprotein Lpp